MSAIREFILNGTALALVVVSGGIALAADATPLPTPATANDWNFDAAAEFGGRVFINKPGNTSANSAAKYNQYGTITGPVFLNMLNVGAGTKDGSFAFDLRGKSIGTNDQGLEAEISQPGRQSLDLGWYQTPDLRSNTAQTIFNGVGTSNLTVPSSVVQQLYNGIFNSTSATTGNAATYNKGVGTNSTVPVQNQTLTGTTFVPNGCLVPGQTGALGCAPGVTPVKTTILNNEHPISIGLQRDRKEVDYSWTPNENWTFKVDYSHEHRYGVQEQGFLFSSSTSTPMAAVPAPVNDVTNDASVSAEYYGKTPWDMKWNGLIKYSLSLYDDSLTSFTAENPFGGPASPVGASVPLCPVASATAVNNCYGIGQMGTSPSNASNSIMGQIGVDLPGFRNNRYMSTLQYNSMTQNASFIPMTINGLGTTGSYPITGGTLKLAPVSRGSLNGEIDTLLWNNVLSTQLTTDLKNKLSYRYYSDKNNTPALTLANWIVNDAAIAGGAGSVGGGSYAPHTTLFSSYTKQNASDQLDWNINNWASVGASAGWEQYQYSLYAANLTNEYTEKLYTRLAPTDWFAVRLSDAQSVRRYDKYNWQQFLGNEILGSATGTGFVENPSLVDYNIANRNRNVGNIYIDFTTPVPGLTLTPTAGIRWDDYPTDKTLLNNGLNQLGLKSDHNWSLGLEADWQLNTDISFMVSYTHENILQNMVGTSSGANELTLYSSRMGEKVDTVVAAANFQLIPDVLGLKLSATHEFANDSWITGALPGCLANNAAGTNCGITSPGNPAYPPNNTRFDQFGATLSYNLDKSILAQFHLKEAVLQLHYTYEINNVTNWQANGSSPYLYSTLNASTVAFKDMIFLAGDNPNYKAQAVMASAVLKW